MSDPILLEINEGIALVTLNRPDKLNALNYALIDRLMATLDAIETDDSVRAVILTGAGERAFPPAPTSTNFRRASAAAAMPRCATSSRADRR